MRNTPKRRPENVAISISLTTALLIQIDNRVAELGITRSQFLALLARQNIDRRGPLIIGGSENNSDNMHEAAPAYSSPHLVKRTRANGGLQQPAAASGSKAAGGQP